MVHVLVVEDDIRLNQIVCASLRSAGYDARGCTNAVEAFDLLHADGADIIISDIRRSQRQQTYSDSADDRAGRHERQAKGFRRGH